MFNIYKNKKDLSCKSIYLIKTNTINWMQMKKTSFTVLDIFFYLGDSMTVTCISSDWFILYCYSINCVINVSKYKTAWLLDQYLKMFIKDLNPEPRLHPTLAGLGSGSSWPERDMCQNKWIWPQSFSPTYSLEIHYFNIFILVVLWILYSHFTKVNVQVKHKMSFLFFIRGNWTTVWVEWHTPWTLLSSAVTESQSMSANVVWCSLNHSACEPDETWRCHCGTCPHHSLIFHTCLILFRVTGSAAPGHSHR